MDYFLKTTEQRKEESGSEEGRARTEVGETRFEAEGGSPKITPVAGRSRKRHRRTRSGSGSPKEREKEGEEKDMDYRGKLEKCKETLEETITEFREYLSQFSVAKHEAYFNNKFRTIVEIHMDIVDTYGGMMNAYYKNKGIEGRIMDFVESREKKLEGIKKEVLEGVERANNVLLEKVRGEIDRCISIMEVEDANRGKDLGKMEEIVRSQKKEVSLGVREELKQLRGTIGSELKTTVGVKIDKIREEGLGKLENIGSGVIEVREAMDRVVRKQADRVIEELKGGIEIGNLDPGRSMHVIREVLQQEIPKIGREVCEGEGNREKETWSEVVRKRGKRGPRVVVETSERIDKGKAREELKRCLDPVGGEVRVRNIGSRRGNFIVEVESEEDIRKLREDKGMREAGFKVNGEPEMLDPMLILLGVDKDFSEADVKKSVWNKNRETFVDYSDYEVWDKEFKLKFKKGPRESESVSWVAQVSTGIYGRLIRKGRIYVGLHSCRVRAFEDITRCFRCQGIGHTSRFCQRPITCSRCGSEGHHVTRCDRGKEGPRCANCLRMGFKDVNHSGRWRECPSIVIYRRRRERNTRYEI